MAITKDNNGNIIEGPFDQKVEFERSGSVRTDVFSIVDPIKRLNQIRFDTADLPDETNVTIRGNPSTSGDIIITLPSSSGTLSTGGGGGGDVSGPGMSTDKAVARWSGTDGTTIQDSAVVIDDSGNLTATNISGSFSGSSSGTNTGDVTVTDTDSVDLTLTGQDLSADVKLSGSTLTTDVSGIKVATAGITDNEVATGIDAGKIADGSVSSAEFEFLNGVTSPIQAQFADKVTGPASAADNSLARFDGTTGKLIQSSAATVDDTGVLTVGQIIDSGLTASTVPYADGSKQLVSSAVTPTELGYLSGVTSSIQPQFSGKLDNTDGLYSLANTSDATKKQAWDLSGETSGKTLTIAPQNTSNMTVHLPQVATVNGTGMALIQDETTGFIFGAGITSSIGAANSMFQLANATTANRAQIKLHSYANASSVAGVSTLTSRSGTIAVNSSISAGQDYSKWTAQAAAATAGSAPISGSWAFKANAVNSLTVPSDFHIQLTNSAGTIADRLYLSSEGALQLPGYSAGYAKFDSSGNVTSVLLTAPNVGYTPSVGGDWSPVPDDVAEALDQLAASLATKFTLPSLTAGSVLFSDGSTIDQDNANFYWDNVAKRLDIGGTATFGNITEINTVPYSFPSSQGSASDVLTNDGSGNLTWAPVASSPSQVVEQFVLDATNISNGFVVLANPPTTAAATILLVADAGNMFYGDDFSVSSSHLNWTGLALDGVLIAGDKLTVSYN